VRDPLLQRQSSSVLMSADLIWCLGTVQLSLSEQHSFTQSTTILVRLVHLLLRPSFHLTGPDRLYLADPDKCNTSLFAS